MEKELNQNSLGGKSIKRILGSYGIVFVLIALIVIFTILSNRFLTADNIFNILRQVSIVGIIAVGMTFIMLTGGIDLSVGSVAGFAGVGAALLMTEQAMNPVLAAIIMCLFGIGLGLANGFFISKLAVPPFIATLGMMVSIRGLAYIITGGLPVFGFDKNFTQLGQGYLGPIPIPVLIMAGVFVFGIIFLTRTRAGRHIYGVGGNEEASRLSGVNVSKIKFLVYAVGGFMSALAGLVILARTNSGQPNAGEGYEMDVITGVVLGGVSMTGGQGKLYMVIIGVLIMGILQNGMTMLGINEFVQKFVRGMVLIAAVAFDSFIKAQRAKEVTE
ncbi:ribose ABC transporter permease [Christensenella minuta]|uniref:Putative ribose ABC transporter permease protein n=1 Tax=Christensenella minuta TaxID=626937 RepID=A0A136Q5H4_9FIRM|nr:ABC transporter permease [Christensenella minuta]AYH40130.1 ABC transporter permease [Christensenella minuta]KXK65935.1 putative ribose ABC transporter permease protein [Christensenella minuta]OAQ43384.1 ribose ABC transporter permease [Christensenella minuta]